MSVSLPTWTHKPLSLKVNNVFQFWINQNKHNRNYPSHSWMYVTSWRTKHEKVVKYSFPVAFRDNTNKNEFTHCFMTCSDSLAFAALFHKSCPMIDHLNIQAFHFLFYAKLSHKQKAEWVELAAIGTIPMNCFMKKVRILGLFFFRPRLISVQSFL